MGKSNSSFRSRIAHLFISMGIGIGIGFIIGHKWVSSSGLHQSTHVIDATSEAVSSRRNQRRKVYGTPWSSTPWGSPPPSGKTLRGKQDTLQPTTAFTTRPVPISSSSPTTKRPTKGGKSTKAPVSSPPAVDTPEAIPQSTSTPTPEVVPTPSPMLADVKCTCSPTVDTDNQDTLPPTVSDTCNPVEEAICCGQPESTPEAGKVFICQELGCDITKCQVEEKSTTPPSSAEESLTSKPTVKVTPSPTPCNKCYPDEKESCCSQEDDVPEADKELICKKLGCKLEECPVVPAKKSSSSPTSAPVTSTPSQGPTTPITLSPTHKPTTSSPSKGPTPKPSSSPTDEPTITHSPSSEPPYFTTLPTKIPTQALDTLRPTTNFPTIDTEDIPAATEFPTESPVTGSGDVTNPPSSGDAPAVNKKPSCPPSPTKDDVPVSSTSTLEPTYQGTPTVSKETTAPPTMKHNRPTSVKVQKQFGSNDYKPHYVFTSKIQTECTRENEGNVIDGMWVEDGGCVLHCTETTKLYEGDFLINEVSNKYKSECSEDGEDEETTVHTVEHTIESNPGPSSQTRSYLPKPSEDGDTGSDDGYDDYFAN